MEDVTPRPGKEFQSYRLSFHGSAGTLFGIYIVNTFLVLITLGIYSFWGKTRMRKYLFSQTAFSQDRFVYHGTGGELLKGFLIVFLVFGIPLIAIQFIQELVFNIWVQLTVGLLSWILTLALISVATVGAWRYRLSRTSWRAIRFSFRGKTAEMFKLYFAGGLLTVVTAGFYYPFFVIRHRRFLITNAYFGNSRFHFDGRNGGLFGDFVFALLMAMVAALISWLPLSTGFSSRGGGS